MNIFIVEENDVVDGKVFGPDDRIIVTGPNVTFRHCKMSMAQLGEITTLRIKNDE